VPKDRIAILLNPSAGRGKALKKRGRLERLLKELGIPFELTVSASEENLRALTRECASRYGAVVGAGGDSTFQIMIEEIARSGAEVDFGLIALGSSNDVAREFDLHSTEKACQALKRRRTRSIDLGVVEQEGKTLKCFIGQANVGLGAQVNRYVQEISGRRPHLAAFQSLAGTLGVIRSYRRKEVPIPLSVEAAERREDGLYIVANFSNIRFWASGKMLNPSALPDDGQLDGCLIGKCRLPRLAHLAFLARRGRHVDAPEVDFLRASAYEISSEREFAVQADGEIIGGTRTPLLFKNVLIRVIPRALRLIC
jgi:diacylglycerol kinase (ATP)